MSKAQEWATVRDMAQEHNISIATVYRRVESGAWPAGRNGKLIRFSPEQQDEIKQLITRGDTGAFQWDRIEAALNKLSA